MLILGDFRTSLPQHLTLQSVDTIIYDPPYGIGASKLEHKKKKWKKSSEDWDEFESVDAQYEFYLSSLRMLIPYLKETGSLFAFGSRHCIFMIGEILQRQLHCTIINSIVWNKTNAMFTVTRSSLTEGTEYIIWAAPGKFYFDYELSKTFNNGKQLRNVWSSPVLDRKESLSHPHQKPTWLIQRLIKLSCPPQGFVLDPMCGSGTTEVIARYERLGSLSIERNEKYHRIAENRIKREADITEPPQS